MRGSVDEIIRREPRHEQDGRPEQHRDNGGKNPCRYQPGGRCGSRCRGIDRENTGVELFHFCYPPFELIGSRLNAISAGVLFSRMFLLFTVRASGARLNQAFGNCGVGCPVGVNI